MVSDAFQMDGGEMENAAEDDGETDERVGEGKRWAIEKPTDPGHNETSRVDGGGGGSKESVS